MGWLPCRCLLCGGAGQRELGLCADCLAELPRNHIYCQRCALPLAEPAERCGACQRREPPWDSAWAPFRYAWPLDQLEARFKFGADLACGQVLARLWGALVPPARPACLLPVPLHRTRLRERGYNQAHELARHLARAWRLPCRIDVLERVRATTAQTELDAKARRRNVRGAFQVTRDTPLPEHVALIDDVSTTGTTLTECARVLRRAGVRRIDAWTLARAPR